MAVQQQQQANMPSGRLKTSKSNYGVYGILVIGLAIGAFFLGNTLVGKASAFREEMEALQKRRTQAISDKEEYSKKIQRLQVEMQIVQQKAAVWRESEKILNKPYSISALAWMESRAKDQKPQLSATNTNSDDTKKPGVVNIQVSGDFKSLLNWIMESEHELDAIRIVKAGWKAKSAQAVELTLNIEVDNNE